MGYHCTDLDKAAEALRTSEMGASESCVITRQDDRVTVSIAINHSENNQHDGSKLRIKFSFVSLFDMSW
jgi:hypothetical protein